MIDMIAAITLLEKDLKKFEKIDLLKILITLFTVPIDSTKGIKMLYVFVDIKLDASHFNL